MSSLIFCKKKKKNSFKRKKSRRRIFSGGGGFSFGKGRERGGVFSFICLAAGDKTLIHI